MCYAGAMFVSTIMDRYWRADMTLDEAVELMKKAIDEI